MVNKVIVNIITGSRMILGTVFSYYIITESGNIALFTILFAMIGLSDLMDGFLARNLSACSTLGAILDVLMDLYFIVAASVSLIIIKEYPAWMLAVIIGKFLEFWLTSSYVRRQEKYGENIFLFDPIGRKVAVLFYVLPYAVILISDLLPKEISTSVLNLFCISILAGAVISSVNRVKSCIEGRSTIYNM